MKLPKGWRIGFIYIAMMLVLGLTTLTYGLARLESWPQGQEVVAQANDQTKEQSADLGIADQVARKEQDANPEESKLKMSLSDFPSPVQVEPLRGVENYFSDNLNSYLFHAGRDYPLAEGAMIRATHGGKVTFAGADPILGQKVEIDCGEDWRVVYGGLDNLRVQQGEIIEENDILGQIGYYSGADGVNDRTQLHYEVWKKDQVQGE